jgi:hypothetical protein
VKTNILDNQWVYINEETASKGTITCDKITEFDEKTWKL